MWLSSYGVNYGEQYQLELAADLVDGDGDGYRDDVLLSMFINGTEVKIANEKSKCVVDGRYKLGNTLYVYCAPGNGVTLTTNKTEEPDNPVEQKTPEEAGYQKKVTLSEFGIWDGTYNVNTYPARMTAGNYYGESLDGMYLDVNITFPNSFRRTYFNYAGSHKDGWWGLRFFLYEGKLMVERAKDGLNVDTRTIEGETAGIQAGEEFNLKVGTKLEGENLRVDLWINDQLQEEIIFEEAGMFGTAAGIYAPDEESIVISSPKSTTDDEERETLDTSFRQITFGNFKIQDGTYRNEDSKFVEGQYALALNKTVFTGDILISSVKNTSFRYGGKKDGWHGLIFYMRNGNLYMQDAEQNQKEYVFLSTNAGTRLADHFFNLKLSTELVDSDGDGKRDDVKLGVWFNDVLYDNTYIYLVDYAEFLGSYIGLYSMNDNSYFTVKSVEGVELGLDFTLFGFTRNWEQELGINRK